MGAGEHDDRGFLLCWKFERGEFVNYNVLLFSGSNLLGHVFESYARARARSMTVINTRPGARNFAVSYLIKYVFAKNGTRWWPRRLWKKEPQPSLDGFHYNSSRW